MAAPDPLDEARTLHRAGRLAEAAGRYREALRRRPDQPDVLAALGLALKELGRPDQAVACLERALVLAPDDVPARILLADTLRRLGRTVEAIGQYRAAAERDPQPGILNTLANLLKATGDLDGAIAGYTRALAAAPGLRDLHFNLGNALLARGDAAAAVARYAVALRLGGDDPELLNNLGNALRATGDLDAAAEHYRRALALRPDFAEAHANLGIALLELGQAAASVASARSALALRPGFPAAATALGNALCTVGRYGEADGCYADALRHDPNDPEANANRGLLRLVQGDFATGWALYDWRWRQRDTRPHGHPQPEWSGDDPAGRSILLHCEQGLGDAIQFVRYAPLVRARGARVALLCPPSLERLFATAPGIDHLAAGPAALPTYDLQVPLLSLPRILGTDLDTIPADVPYLAADPARVAFWRDWLEDLPGLRVALVWQGNPRHRNDRHRSLPPSALAPLLDLPGVGFVGVQPPGATPGDGPHPLSGHPGFRDAGPLLTDFADTAALLAALDLTVAVDTSVVHLAGALGLPVWTLLPYAPDWRWLLERSDSPWYPTMRLFRQRAYGDWDGVVAEVAAALAGVRDGAR